MWSQIRRGAILPVVRSACSAWSRSWYKTQACVTGFSWQLRTLFLSAFWQPQTWQLHWPPSCIFLPRHYIRRFQGRPVVLVHSYPSYRTASPRFWWCGGRCWAPWWQQTPGAPIGSVWRPSSLISPSSSGWPRRVRWFHRWGQRPSADTQTAGRNRPLAFRTWVLWWRQGQFSNQGYQGRRFQ